MAFVFGMVAFFYGKSKLDALKRSLSEQQKGRFDEHSVNHGGHGADIEAVKCPHCGAFVAVDPQCSACGKPLA